MKPQLPQQPNIIEKSVQVNINSVEDAKAVVQNLGRLKTAWEFANAKSVEFVIAEEVFDKVQPTLDGIVGWCRTYTKKSKPIEGNTLFILPHYKAPVARQSPIQLVELTKPEEVDDAILESKDPALVNVLPGNLKDSLDILGQKVSPLPTKKVLIKSSVKAEQLVTAPLPSA